LLTDVLPADKADAALELQGYLVDSFGNPVRIDYGSGLTCLGSLMGC
jgi:hypothetical protein